MYKEEKKRLKKNSVSHQLQRLPTAAAPTCLQRFRPEKLCRGNSGRALHDATHPPNAAAAAPVYLLENTAAIFCLPVCAERLFDLTGITFCLPLCPCVPVCVCVCVCSPLVLCVSLLPAAAQSPVDSRQKLLTFSFSQNNE